MPTHATVPAEARADGKGLRWGQGRRLEFIDFRLLWEGRINRADLVDFFGISIPQASLDLARYMDLAPGNLTYDRSDKVYRATPEFKAAVTSDDSQTYLNQLLGLSSGVLPVEQSLIGWRAPYEVVQYPSRAIAPEILVSILWAIRDKEELEISYQSMRESQISRRWVAPHAVAFDGGRWHVRAYCHAGGEFRDFVFARVQHVHDRRRVSIDASTDRAWHSYATIILRPREGLTAPQRRATEREFGMRDGTLKVTVREALVYYYVRQLHLHRVSESSVIAQPLEWANEKDFKALLQAARK